ncbi:MAG: beta-ketoacyl synthase chain length factor [Bacteroidales bacterium]|nr:beta-ketoacyl synthase chain length factor [Bacteroidales bacterium]
MTYINAIGLIAPQGTIEDGHFACVEPVYKELINPVQLRRMSRILKMGLGASSICVNNLSEAKIDAIIVGTGLACIVDLEKFLVSVLDENEQGLSPIPFINSSHNTVAAQIAMMHKITGYSNTYCHRGASFESALLDALMLLGEGEAQHVLVGGIDEYSQHYQLMINEERKMKDAVIGEGAAFFILEKERRENSFAELKGVHSFLMKDDDFNNNDAPLIKTEISSFLQKHALDMADIDLFVSGKNGNCITDGIYDILERDCFPHAETLYYKHLCGEYMTATGFALDMAARQLKGQKEKRALIYNHYNYINHSLILLQTP